MTQVQSLVGDLRSHTLWDNLSLSAANEPIFSGTRVQQLERGLYAATESPQGASSVPQLWPDAAK